MALATKFVLTLKKFQNRMYRFFVNFKMEPGGVITSSTLLGPVFVWIQQNYLRLLLIVRYFDFRIFLGLLPRGTYQRKSGHENE